MYIQYQNDQFFLPFSVSCSQILMFQIMPALCLYRQGKGRRWGGGEGGQPNVDRPGQGDGGGVPKIPKFVSTSFMDDSLQAPKFYTLAIAIYCYRNLGLAVTIAKIVQNVLETTKN